MGDSGKQTRSHLFQYTRSVCSELNSYDVFSCCVIDISSLSPPFFFRVTKHTQTNMDVRTGLIVVFCLIGLTCANPVKFFDCGKFHWADFMRNSSHLSVLNGQALTLNYNFHHVTQSFSCISKLSSH